MDAPTASLCDTPNSSCWSVSSAWVRSACTEAADGVDADGLYQDESRSSSSYDGGDSSSLQERLQLRSLKVAVDPASGADPYAGVVVDREATANSRRAENIGNMGTESYGTSSSFRQLRGYAMRQDGSTEDFRLSYVASDSSEIIGAWSGWAGSTSTTSSSVRLSFEQGSCTLGGSLSSVNEAMGGVPLDYAYDAVVSDGVHTVKVRNGVGLEVCGQNFWGLLAGGWPIEQDSYGWAELDGVGQVAMLSSWEPAPGDADGDGWPGSLGDCNDSDPGIHPCALDTAGVDRNCDGQVTAAPGVDQDGDGEDVGIDCNDMDAAIFSGATEEIADDVDSNCDGQELCYADSDQDGH
ncbi:MAG TPA: putative metal-binding motif-containing protein, partial [Myxococcota bacterium]|nr:putative metal-binding motif-containing protein [Myxococcota bacterium]